MRLFKGLFYFGPDRVVDANSADNFQDSGSRRWHVRDAGLFGANFSEAQACDQDGLWQRSFLMRNDLAMNCYVSNESANEMLSVL